MLEAPAASAAQGKRSGYFTFFQLPWLTELLAAKDDRATLLQRVYERHSHNRSNFSPAELQPFVDALARPGAAKAMQAAYRAIFMQALKDRSRSGFYPPVENEVLLMWSKDEASLSHEELVPGTDRHAPKVQVRMIGDVGRFLHAERPARINDELVRFLAIGDERVTVHGPQQEYDVVLESAGENKITVIKALRSLTGMELNAALKLVESTPASVKRTTLVDALKIKEQLMAVGATVGVK
jgi:hypothetical protein